MTDLISLGSSLEGKFFQIDKKGKLYTVKFTYNSHKDDGTKESLKLIRGCISEKTANWTQFKIELPRLSVGTDDDQAIEEKE